jgi:hypothetical protein
MIEAACDIAFIDLNDSILLPIVGNNSHVVTSRAYEILMNFYVTQVHQLMLRRSNMNIGVDQSPRIGNERSGLSKASIKPTIRPIERFRIDENSEQEIRKGTVEISGSIKDDRENDPTEKTKPAHDNSQIAAAFEDRLESR